MAVTLTTSTSQWSRTRLAGAKTIMGWFKFTGFGDNWVCFISTDDLTTLAVEQTALVYDLWDGGGSSTGSALSANTWYHMALTASGDGVGATLKAYLNGVEDISRTRAGASSSSSLILGNDAYSEWLQGTMCHFKIWSAVLSATEIANEMRAIRPIRAADLWAWAPALTGESATNRVKDLSGNANDFTEAGTINDGDGPPVQWGGSNAHVQYAAAGQPYAIRGAFVPGMKRGFGGQHGLR